MSAQIAAQSGNDLPPLGRLIVVTGLYQNYVVNLSDLRVKLRLRPEERETTSRVRGVLTGFHRRIKRLTSRARMLSRQMVGVRPPSHSDKVLGFFGIKSARTIKVEGLNMNFSARLSAISDPRSIEEQHGYADASVVVFFDAHGWEDHLKLYEACRKAVLEGKVAVVLGDRSIGRTIAYMMAVSDEPQILTQPCTHVDEEGQICGEPASNWQWVNEDTPLLVVTRIKRIASISDAISTPIRRYFLRGLLRMDIPDLGIEDLLDNILPSESEQRFWEPPALIRGNRILLEATVGDAAYQPRCRRHFHLPESTVIAHGRVSVIIGGPSSQKSARLRLLQIRTARDLGRSTLVVSAREPISRAGPEFTPDATKVESANRLLGELLMPWHRVVIIDEGTLMDNLGVCVRRIADIHRDDVEPPTAELSGREVVVFGRGTNARDEPLPETVELLSHADIVASSPSVCAVCGRDAMKSQYLLGGQPAPYFLTFCLRYIGENVYDDGNVVVQGREKSLEPRCWVCKEVPNTPRQVESQEAELPLSFEVVHEAIQRLQERDLLTWMLLVASIYLTLSHLGFILVVIAVTTLLRWSLGLGAVIEERLRDPDINWRARIRELIFDELRSGNLGAWILVFVLLRILGTILAGFLFP